MKKHLVMPKPEHLEIYSQNVYEIFNQVIGFLQLRDTLQLLTT